MSAPIFISFASKDLSVAHTVCEALENRGFHCWISSRDIGPGENFQVAIVRAIRLAKAMILIFSGNSNISEEVKKELVLAGQNRLVVIPLRVEDVAPDEAFTYEFATRQWIDAFHDWEHAIQRVVEQLRMVDGLAEPSSEAAARSAGPEEVSRRPSPAPAETAGAQIATGSASVAATTRIRSWRWIALPAFGTVALAVAIFLWSSPFGGNPTTQAPKVAATQSAPAPVTPPTTPPFVGRAPSSATVPTPALSPPVAAPSPPREASSPPAAIAVVEAPGSAVSLNPRITDIGIGVPQNSPGSELVGRWGGSSTCSQGDVGVELSLNEVRPDGAVHGSLRFFNLPGQNNTAEGEYTLQGRYYPKDRTLYLQPGGWVKQPPGYAMANFTVAFSPADQTLKGRVSNVSCSTISVTKDDGNRSPSDTAAPRPPG